MSPEESLAAKTSVYRLLFSLMYHERDAMASDTGLPYPYIRLLARFDSHELVGVMSLAFQDPCIEGMIKLVEGSVHSPLNALDTVLERQTVIDILLKVITQASSDFKVFIFFGIFSWFLNNLQDSDVEALYLFIARQLPEYKTFVTIDSALLAKMFAFLTTTPLVEGPVTPAPLKPFAQTVPPSPMLSSPASSFVLSSTPSTPRPATSPERMAQSRERQKALLDLMEVYSPSKQETEKLLALCERAGFYRVCEQIHRNNNRLDLVIECYTRDESRSVDVFQFVHDTLTPSRTPALTADQLRQFRKAVLAAIPEFIRIDGQNTAQMVLEHLSQDYENVLEQLQNTPKLQYKYLQGLLDPQRVKLLYTSAGGSVTINGISHALIQKNVLIKINE